MGRLTGAAGLLLAIAAVLVSWIGPAIAALVTLALACTWAWWDAARRIEAARRVRWPDDDSALTGAGLMRLSGEESLWARLAETVYVPPSDPDGRAPQARTSPPRAPHGSRLLH